MANLNYTVVREGEYTNITVYKVPNFDEPFQADSTHAHWEEILAGVLADDESVLDLFNIANTLKRELVSERVMVADGRLYFDGDEVDDGLAAHVVRMISEGDPQYPAFVNFLEKVYSNPQEHSRKHLFNYVRDYSISITPEGDLIMYKGVYPNLEEFSDQKPYRSGSAGPANVSGYEHTTGYVPQAVGDVVSMPRTATWSDPGVACSTGLHICGYNAHWINGFPTKLVVLVNPRDVVSVPENDSKIRCCRYKIVGVADGAYSDSVVNGIVAPAIPEFDPEPPEESEEPVSEPESPSEPQNAAIQPRSQDEPEKPVQQFSFSQPAPKIKHPSKAEFELAKVKAKTQRKGLKNYIGKRWVLIEGDGTKRQHWSKAK